MRLQEILSPISIPAAFFIPTASRYHRTLPCPNNPDLLNLQIPADPFFPPETRCPLYRLVHASPPQLPFALQPEFRSLLLTRSATRLSSMHPYGSIPKHPKPPIPFPARAQLHPPKPSLSPPHNTLLSPYPFPIPCLLLSNYQPRLTEPPSIWSSPFTPPPYTHTPACVSCNLEPLFSIVAYLNHNLLDVILYALVPSTLLICWNYLACARKYLHFRHLVDYY